MSRSTDPVPARGFGAGPLVVAPEVRDALAAGRPVVALESSLITHGFPRSRNLDVARAAEAAVRAEGAVPATVAVRGGALVVGIDDAGLEELATAEVGKASRHTLGAALARSGWWGTTVSATMIAAHLAGIRVFATGGIGGVHRGAAASLDVSADLEELARTPVAVVCAGPKAILDVAATLEVLETRGVPAIGVGTGEVPGFWSRGSGVAVPITVVDEREAAEVIARHWALGLGSGVLVTVPIPDAHELPRAEADAAVAHAVAEAREAGRTGPTTTPWILARVAELTEGRSVDANAALVANNCGAAARLAVALRELAPRAAGGAA